MSETLSARLTLTRWQGDRGTYHLVTFTGEEAEALSTHAALHKLEFGRQRGFGSVKLVARIGETEWQTSVFPQRRQRPSDRPEQGSEQGHAPRDWVLLVSRKVMRAEDLAAGEPVEVKLTL